MNAIAQTMAAPVADAYASVTLWSFGNYFLQAHHGYFDCWEDAEDFAAQPLRLEQRSLAVFLIHDGRASFVPDASLQIYRNVTATAIAALALTVDDLLEDIDLEQMQLTAIGHSPVTRGQPIVARPMYDLELETVAANGPR